MSDVGRLLEISRQHAQRLARKAELAGAIELVRNHDDRRIVQLLLTPRGRSELKYARREEKMWIAALLLGLDMPHMATATHARGARPLAGSRVSSCTAPASTSRCSARV